MLFRCPTSGCPTFDAPASAAAACPRCGARAEALTQIESRPPATPEPNQPRNLEEQIYDGLPPLSVMLALRRRRDASYDEEDFARRYPMTPDDWRALSAYESILRAAASLRMSFKIAWIVVGVHGVGILASILSGAELKPGPAEAVCLMAVLAAAAGWLYYGTSALDQIRAGWTAESTLWAATTIAIVYLGGLVWSLAPMFQRHYGETPNLVCAAASAIGLVDIARSALRVRSALDQIAPPEIRSRLEDAIKYL